MSPLQSLSCLSLLLLMDALVAEAAVSWWLCSCGCGNQVHKQSPLRRH